jgi:hypothetical protein
MNKAYILLSIFLLGGCYDPKPLVDVFNNSKYPITILGKTFNPQSTETRPFYRDINITYHEENKKCTYAYHIQRGDIFDEDFLRIYEKYSHPNLKIQLNADKKIYLVYPNIDTFPVNKDDLMKMQKKVFPITFSEKHCTDTKKLQ